MATIKYSYADARQARDLLVEALKSWDLSDRPGSPMMSQNVNRSLSYLDGVLHWGISVWGLNRILGSLRHLMLGVEVEKPPVEPKET